MTITTNDGLLSKYLNAPHEKVAHEAAWLNRRNERLNNEIRILREALEGILTDWQGMVLARGYEFDDFDTYKAARAALDATKDTP